MACKCRVLSCSSRFVWLRSFALSTKLPLQCWFWLAWDGRGIGIIGIEGSKFNNDNPKGKKSGSAGLDGPASSHLPLCPSGCLFTRLLKPACRIQRLAL